MKINHLLLTVFLSLSNFFPINAYCGGSIIALGDSAELKDSVTEPQIKASRPPEQNCTWKTLDSAEPKISLLYQECDFGFRKVTYKIEGTAVIESYSDSPTSSKVIEIFSKTSSDSAKQTLIKQFIEKLDPYEKKHCIPKLLKSNVATKNKKEELREFWTIISDKEYDAKIMKETPEGDMPPDVCGYYAQPVDSNTYFIFHKEKSSQFIWVNAGQDTPLFDEESIKF